MTSMVPTPVPTPRPLRNPTNTDQIGAGHGGRAAQDLDEGLTRDDAGQQDRDGALQQVADDNDDRPLSAERPKGVGPAGSPGPDGPWVNASRIARDEHAYRDRAREVGDQHQDQCPDHDRGVQGHAPASVGDARRPAAPKVRSLAPASGRPGRRNGPLESTSGTIEVPSETAWIAPLEEVASRHRRSRSSAAAVSWNR